MLALKRELDGMGGTRPAGCASDARPAEPFSGAVDSLTYVEFEDRFRGSQPRCARRVEDYLPILTRRIRRRGRRLRPRRAARRC